MSHADLLEAVWEAVPPGVEPERFDVRRDWLLGHVAPGERVVDVGCGEGAFSAALRAAGALPTGVEVVAEPLRRGRARFGVALELTLAPLEGPLPFADGGFDAAWLGETLEHLVDPVGTLGDVRRVLRPGGRLLVTTPDHPPDLLRALADDPPAFARHFDPRADHLRFLNAHALGDLLEGLGFAVVELTSDGQTLFAVGRR